MGLLEKGANPYQDNDTSGLVESLLFELSERLARLSATGEESTIDLKSLPMMPAVREALAERLGEGEVAASIHVAGESNIRETAFAGIWWVRHHGADGHLASEQIEIAAIPEILRAHHEDISYSAKRLAEHFNIENPERLDKDTPHV